MFFKDKISKKTAQELFSNPEKVLEFIAGIKWENGFICRKCGNENYCEGKTAFSRRCTRCKKEESATAHTIFHNVKFPINKAFYIAYNVCVLQKDFSSYNFAEQLDINQMTCWKFKKRILQCINEIGKKKNLPDIVLYKTIAVPLKSKKFFEIIEI